MHQKRSVYLILPISYSIRFMFPCWKITSYFITDVDECGNNISPTWSLNDLSPLFILNWLILIMLVNKVEIELCSGFYFQKLLAYDFNHSDSHQTSGGWHIINLSKIFKYSLSFMSLPQWNESNEHNAICFKDCSELVLCFQESEWDATLCIGWQEKEFIQLKKKQRKKRKESEP